VIFIAIDPVELQLFKVKTSAYLLLKADMPGIRAFSVLCGSWESKSPIKNGFKTPSKS